MATTYLTRTPSSTGSQTKFTFSFWWKNNCVHGNDKCLFSSGLNSSNYCFVRTTADKMEFLALDNSVATMRYKPTRLYRDANAWYHIVIAIDTTQAGGNRLKWYTNGVRETAFDISTEPNQNTNLLYINDTTTHAIGRKNVTSDKYMEGTLSHYHFIDGTQYDASEFGEYDANGVWTIKTSPSVTYGTNGFFILKDGNSVTDQSGNSNNFTVAGGTLTNTEDNPSNVFATWNALDNYYPAMTLSYGNTKALTTVGRYTYIPSTLGMTSGKYYAEIKCTAQSGSQEEFLIGITSTSTTSTIHEVGHYGNDYGYKGTSGNYRSSNVDASYGSSYTTGDIIGIAVDLDNNKLYFSKNGTWQNSGDPTSGATGTGAISITDPTSTLLGGYFFAVCYFSSTDTGTYDANFGNGYFGTTAVASAGTNASGIGIFEYDVPTGYTALSTKGLNL
jgi:hypothetical protein